MKCAVLAESLMVDELYGWNRNLMDMVVWLPHCLVGLPPVAV